MLGAGAFGQLVFADAWFSVAAPEPVSATVPLALTVTVDTAATRTTYARTKASERVRVSTAGRARRKHRWLLPGKAG